MVAVASGFLFSYYNAKVAEERKARIERVNKQLKHFYGPLLACITSSRASFSAMVEQHSPDGTQATFVHTVRADPQGAVARAYRTWMVEVLQPLNEKAANIVTEHLDLLDGPGPIEAQLLQLVAATSAYRVILESWRQGDLSAHSVITYPDKLAESIRVEFSCIKQRQARLLGTKSRFAGGPQSRL